MKKFSLQSSTCACFVEEIKRPEVLKAGRIKNHFNLEQQILDDLRLIGRIRDFNLSCSQSVEK